MIDDADRNYLGRTRPEARHIAERGARGVVGQLIVEGQQVQPVVSSYKPRSKTTVLGRVNVYDRDFLKDNVRRMRKIQKVTQDKVKDSAQPVKALWKSEKWSNVPSKVSMELTKEPPPPRPSSAQFLRAHSRCGPPVFQSRSRPASPVMRSQSACQDHLADTENGAVADKENQTRQRPSSARPAVVVRRPESRLDAELKREHVNWIEVNGRAARYSSVARSPSATILNKVKEKQQHQFQQYRRGEVPEYLRQRQAEWKKAAEEKLASQPDPDQPAGHRRLADEDRLKTLEMLKESREQLLNELQRLPLRQDTLRIQRKREDLEQKLCEIDEAVKVFSKRKVFVKQQ